MNAANHRCQMRHEHQFHRLAGDRRQTLADLRPMAVARNAVRLEIIAGLGQQNTHFGLAPRPAHPGFSVGDQRFGVDDTRLQQRQKAELHRRRIAAGIGHQPRLADGLAIDFGKTVDRLGQQFRAGVRHSVPPFPIRRLAKPEIGRQIDDFHALLQQRWHTVHGGAVGGGEKHHIAALQHGVVRLDKGQIHLTAQVGKQVADLGAFLAARGDDRQFHSRMRGQQPQQFNAGIARPTDDSHFDHGCNPPALGR